jgi:NTP pyrophosphatase (non-canonical NTP hydrolase)
MNFLIKEIPKELFNKRESAESLITDILLLKKEGMGRGLLKIKKKEFANTILELLENNNKYIFSDIINKIGQIRNEISICLKNENNVPDSSKITKEYLDFLAYVEDQAKAAKVSLDARLKNKIKTKKNPDKNNKIEVYIEEFSEFFEDVFNLKKEINKENRKDIKQNISKILLELDLNKINKIKLFITHQK